MPPDRVLWIGIGEIGQAHQIEIVIADRVALGGRDMVGLERQAEGDVLLHRQPGEYAVLLEDDAAFGAGPRDGASVEQDLAGRRLLEAGQHAHHGGLAAAGRTDHRDEIAVVDVVADVLDDVERPFGVSKDSDTLSNCARACTFMRRHAPARPGAAR